MSEFEILITYDGWSRPLQEGIVNVIGRSEESIVDLQYDLKVAFEALKITKRGAKVQLSHITTGICLTYSDAQIDLKDVVLSGSHASITLTCPFSLSLYTTVKDNVLIKHRTFDFSIKKSEERAAKKAKPDVIVEEEA